MKLHQMSRTTPLLLAFAILTPHVHGQITNAPNLSTVTNASGNSASTATASSTSSNSANPTITGSSATGSNTQTVPTLSSSTAAGGLTGLPKLSNGYTIPTAAVPSTAGAAYMQSSSYPEGTVFIIVGAILGFMALTVVAWRGFAVWSLHRNTKRAAMADSSLDKKPLFRKPAPPMYSYKDHESKASLGNFGAGKKGFGGGGAMASAQSLFFSPTANAVGSSAIPPQNRNSSYLPAGYYAAGVSLPGGHGATESISLSNLAPAGHNGYARADDYSPPDSPGFPATHLGNGDMGRSELDLNPRTPSAVLDDMFDYRDGEGSGSSGHERQRSLGRF